MLDEVVDGLLEAARLAHWERCQTLITEALVRLQTDEAESRRGKVTAVTRQMIAINSILRRIDYRVGRLPVPAVDKALYREQLKQPFLMRRRELVAQKRRASLGRE